MGVVVFLFEVPLLSYRRYQEVIEREAIQFSKSIFSKIV